MDSVDLHILRRLTWKPFDPADAGRPIAGPWDIARDLGVHGNTVKRRLRRMHASGVLDGLHLLPALGLIGLQGGLFEFRFATTREKRQGVDHLTRRRATVTAAGTLDAYSFVGSRAWVAVAAPAATDLAAFVRELAAEAGAEATRWVEPRDWQPQVGAVRPTDARIMLALHNDALRSVVEVAEDAGVAPRTVRSRLGRLARHRAFLIAPYLRPSKIQGLIPMVIAAEAGGGSAVGPRFLNEFPEAFQRSFPQAPVPYVMLGAQDAEEVEEFMERAHCVPGVHRAECLLIESSVPCPAEDPVTSPVRLLDGIADPLEARG